LTDAAWESQTVDVLVVVVVFILLPVRIGIKAVGTGGFMVFWTSGWGWIEESRMDEAETKGQMECLGSMVVSVDRAEWVSMEDWQDEMTLGMAELEVTTEVLVETDDRTKCPAPWMEFDSSFYSSYKVQTGSAPTEVETEGVTCSGSARSQLAWAHTTEEKTAGLGTLAELDHKVQIGCVPA